MFVARERGRREKKPIMEERVHTVLPHDRARL